LLDQVLMDLLAGLARAAQPGGHSALIAPKRHHTEAVEAAIKLASYHTSRPCFISFYGAFHGRTMGALAFTASKGVQRAVFSPMLSGVTHIPYPDPYRPLLQGQGTQNAAETVISYLEQTLFLYSPLPQRV
jgi:4-aminobutyrate aminotransferase